MTLTEAVEFLEARGMKVPLTTNLELVRKCAETIQDLEQTQVDTISVKPGDVVLMEGGPASNIEAEAISKVGQTLEDRLGFKVPIIYTTEPVYTRRLEFSPGDVLVVSDPDHQISLDDREKIEQKLEKHLGFLVKVFVFPEMPLHNRVERLMDLLPADERKRILSKYR